MLEAHYLEIRIVHIASVSLSGMLFVVRGLAWNILAAPWAMARPMRYLSWTVDTALLIAALLLMSIIRQYPVQDTWLTVKLVLLFPYIVLGYLALRGRSQPIRLLCLAGAVLIFGFIYSVARTHDPLGLLT